MATRTYLAGLAVVWLASAAAIAQPPATADDFGPESHGLRCRLVAVSPDSDDDLPDLSNVTDRFVGGNQLTFAVELQNVSDRHLTLIGVRYGDSYPTAKGKLNTAFLGPHLFSFEFSDAEGRPIARADRHLADLMMVISGASAHRIAPGQSLTVNLRPAQFMAPMNYQLPPGNYQAKVRYRGPAQAMVDQIKKHWPDRPHVDAFTHEVVSNRVAFSIDADPTAPTPPLLIWGPVHEGLQAAIELQVARAVAGVPTEPPGIPTKTSIGVVFHVKNVGDQPVTFVSEIGRQGDEIRLINSKGEEVAVSSAFYSGWPIDVRWNLKPGDVAELPLLTPSIPELEQPGQYSVSYKIRFNSRQSKDEEGNVVFPAPADWQSELETGNTPLFLRPRTSVDDDNERPITFAAKLALVDEDGVLAESGKVTIRGEIKSEHHVDQPLGPKPVVIRDCTASPVTVIVRAPGFEEALFYDVKFQAGQTTTLQLKRAAAATFRLVSSDDGQPISGAKVRFFNSTSAKASGGPFPVDGIEGPVWASSQDDGQVVLDMLQRVNQYYEELGDAMYYFYIEPASAELAPRFVGPLKAGQDLGDVTLGRFLEVRGQIHGTPEQLDRFAAEWDQPFELTTENPEAAWLYAVSRRLEVKREADFLSFHLTGLRPGKLRIIGNFGPRPHKVSHTYARRDASETDTVVQFELTDSVDDLVVTPEGRR